MIDSAMSADAVFSKFYDWLFENLDDAPEFLVWGNSDGDFIRHTSRHATALKAKMALGYICGNYRDYAKMCKKELKWEYLVLWLYNLKRRSQNKTDLARSKYTLYFSMDATGLSKSKM